MCFAGSAWAQLLLNAQTLQSPRISHEKLRRHFNQNKMPLWKLEGAQLRHMQDSVCQELWLDWQMSQAQGVPGLSTTSERLNAAAADGKNPLCCHVP